MVLIETRPRVLHRMRDNDSQPVQLLVKGVVTEANTIQLHLELTDVIGGIDDKVFNEVVVDAVRDQTEGVGVFVFHFMIMTRHGGVPRLIVSSPDKLFDPVQIRGSSRTKGPGAFGRLSPHRMASAPSQADPIGFRNQGTPALEPAEPASLPTPRVREETTDPVEPVSAAAPMLTDDPPEDFGADVSITPTSPPLARIAPPERPPLANALVQWDDDSDEVTPTPAPSPAPVQAYKQEEDLFTPRPEDPANGSASDGDSDVEVFVDDEPTDGSKVPVPPEVHARIQELFPGAPVAARPFSMDAPPSSDVRDPVDTDTLWDASSDAPEDDSSIEIDLPPEPVPAPTKRFVRTIMSDNEWRNPTLLLIALLLVLIGGVIGVQLNTHIGQPAAVDDRVRAPALTVSDPTPPRADTPPLKPEVESTGELDLPPPPPVQRISVDDWCEPFVTDDRKCQPLSEEWKYAQTAIPVPDPPPPPVQRVVEPEPEPAPEPPRDTRVCTNPKLLHGASGGPEPDGCFISGCEEGYASAWTWTGSSWDRCEVYAIEQDDTSCVRLTDADGTSHTKRFKNGQWIPARCRPSI